MKQFQQQNEYSNHWNERWTTMHVDLYESFHEKFQFQYGAKVVFSIEIRYLKTNRMQDFTHVKHNAPSLDSVQFSSPFSGDFPETFQYWIDVHSHLPVRTTNYFRSEMEKFTFSSPLVIHAPIIKLRPWKDKRKYRLRRKKNGKAKWTQQVFLWARYQVGSVFFNVVSQVAFLYFFT